METTGAQHQDFSGNPVYTIKRFESIIIVTENTVMLTSESDNKIQGNKPK